MPSGTTKYKKTALNKKIKINSDYEESWSKNFSLLCELNGINASEINLEEKTIWKDLCLKLMEDLIPGFQTSKKAGKKRRSFSDDYPIYQDYTCNIEFLKLAKHEDKSITNVSRKREIHRLSEQYSCTEKQISEAVERAKKLCEDNPHAAYVPETCDSLPEYVTQDPDPQWNKKNRWKKNQAEKLTE